MAESSVTPSKMEPTFTTCPGRNYLPQSGPWYVPPGMTPQQCTFCWVCYEENIKGTSADKGFTIFERSYGNCNCDFETNWVKTCPGTTVNSPFI